jgi:hypothetical protein
VYERLVDEVLDELAEEYDAGYDEDLFADVGFEGDRGLKRVGLKSFWTKW